jgi:non-lysosomal glucosylceramidase
MNRRDFLEISGLGALALSAGGTNVYGAPGVKESDVAENYAKLIPADKGLDSDWVQLLTARGSARRYTKRSELNHIGMPVGGLFAGTVYLGGDGRLWLWNVLNDDSEGIEPRQVQYKGQDVRMRDGANYVVPTPRTYPFEQNFALRVGGKVRTLDADGFANVSFTGQYPIGEVHYTDEDFPVAVTLSAFSPFIPLNTPDSSLPATIMSYQIRNTGNTTVECDLIGWLANPVCLRSRKDFSGYRHNAIVSDASFTALNCTASALTSDNGSERSDATGDLEKTPDFGAMALAVLMKEGQSALGTPQGREPTGLAGPDTAGTASLADELIGSVGAGIALKPGESTTIDFIITWHFPNLSAGDMKNVGREYANRFHDALDVTRYVVKNFERLSGDTRLWRDTWYDSTLPHWFLDRTMANTSILATTTAYRFADGRFWAWEGIGCCHGTCTHVWHYAQAMGRLFPDVERRHREEVDFGIALKPDGAIGMRAHLSGANHVADDGQCGRILGAYREHQMSEDDAFLTRNWPKIKQAILFMIKRDENRDGILEGAQHNTLDAAWYGRISFLASLYLAMLRAGEAMATEMGDDQFAAQCRGIADKGATTILELYNGEYFFHELDPEHIDNVAIGTGCYIDQVFGQFWAHQVGLGHLFDREKIRSALTALYQYNFVSHIGNFRNTFTRGRWYATDNDKGLIMCSWPKGGLNEKWHEAWQFMYFNECMTGFEWQAAAHMIAEGLVQEGLAVARAIHDRYDASLRNPYNEIECSDHYARSMASYGAYLSACGYETHGPQGHLGFAPRVRQGNTFKCAFTAAGGWGSFIQETEARFKVAVKWGAVKVKTLGLGVSSDGPVTASLPGKALRCRIERREQKTVVVFEEPVSIKAGEVLTVEL